MWNYVHPHRLKIGYKEYAAGLPLLEFMTAHLADEEGAIKKEPVGKNTTVVENHLGKGVRGNSAAMALRPKFQGKLQVCW